MQEKNAKKTQTEMNRSARGEFDYMGLLRERLCLTISLTVVAVHKMVNKPHRMVNMNVQFIGNTATGGKKKAKMILPVKMVCEAVQNSHAVHMTTNSGFHRIKRSSNANTAATPARGNNSGM